MNNYTEEPKDKDLTKNFKYRRPTTSWDDAHYSDIPERRKPDEGKWDSAKKWRSSNKYAKTSEGTLLDGIYQD